MSTRPGEGERRAARGYRPQYLASAAAILDALKKGDMEWVRVADPEAGRVDDLQIARTARVDGYQVKWKQYRGTVTLRDLVHGTNKEPSLIAQLADGWRRLRTLHPRRRVVVHLVTNAIPSSSTSAWRPEIGSPPTPYHFAAFIAQAWRPTQLRGRLDLEGEWAAVWESIRTAGGLSADEFPAFVLDCSLDFEAILPEEGTDVLALSNFLFATAAGAEHIIELSHEELLRRLGWTRRYAYRNIHEFPAPMFLYRPIQNTVEAVKAALTGLPGGYVGVFGPPGSGKSTLLTRTLRALPIRLVRYYAYVPEAQDPSVLRGESINFLHDVTLRLQEAGIERAERPDPSDRTALLNLFHRQLQALGDDYVATETKSVILIDGLDHIAREQRPERSLLRDLPPPEAVHDGVYIVVGSQTDELANLPPRVHHVLNQQERRIEMGRLTPSDVHTIAEEAVPILNADEHQQVFELSSGHPLALIYLLKQLRQAECSEERARLLDQAIPYRDDIEEQYWGHWRDIRDDEVLVHTLALLARVRGAIPMTWVGEWLESVALRGLQRLFLQYFEEEGEDRWAFFHNSFRLFLQERTAELLPGRTVEQQNQAYHRELARRYEASPVPWRWEALYHQYSAGEYDAVVGMATQEWFREQVEALRPLDAVQTDARLALQAAGVCRDVVALARLTLVGAALEQRDWTLENRPLPDLLLKAGEAVRAAEHLRDGNRLRVDAEQALRLSTRVIEAGLAREGRRLFELAEPLEFLSGRPIPDDHTRPQNLRDLLREWVRIAIIFRGADETIHVVRRIRVEPSRIKREDAEQASQRLQNWLLFQGALACSERGDWAAWQTLVDELDENGDRLERFFALLRSAEWAHKTGETDRACALLRELLTTLKPEELDAGAGRWQTEAHLSVAELALHAANDEAVAPTWIGGVPPIPLSGTSYFPEREPTLHELRFRRARLLYLLGETREPRALLKEAEAQTSFGGHVKDEEKAQWRQTALAVLCLARLWAWGRLGDCIGPATFLKEVRWILDLFGLKGTLRHVSLHFTVTGVRAEVLRYVVAAAAAHGDEVVTALREELGARWTDSDEGPLWGTNLQCELIVALVEAGADQAWAKAQLRRIEPVMFQDLDPYSRVEACEAQAEAWLALGEPEAAVIELRRMVGAARGILSEKDYQLPGWVNWLGRINELEPDQTEERTRLMLRRILSVQGSASGVADAAEELLDVVFRWSPRRAVRLLKGLLEHHIVGHQGGVARLLREALDAQDAPVKEINHVVVDLALPLVPDAEPDVVEALIARTSDQLGRDAALNVARYLVRRIRVDALADSRAGWYRGVATGLRTVGFALDQVGLQPSELDDQSRRSSSQLDEGFHLESGERLGPDEVLAQVRTVDDLRALLEAEDRGQSRSFDWAAVVEHLAPQLDFEPQLGEVEGLIEERLTGKLWSENQLSQSLVALSKRFLELGDRVSAWTLAEQALDATKASGWDPYFDGGARHTALQQLIAIDPDQAREMAIELYTRDLGERFRAPGRVVLHLYDVLTLLSGEVPVAEVWPAIETYLDELFATVLVEPLPALEAMLEDPVGTPEEDTPDRAVADLLALYLDHPSYSVAQAAVRACTAALLDGSQAVTTAVQGALAGTDQAIERALMVLDAASIGDPLIVVPFEGTLERLCSSPNFTVRLIASAVHARIGGKPPIPEPVERKTPAIYGLHLPTLALHRTEQVVGEDYVPVLVGDPALILRPLDIEARAIAKAAGLPEDNVLYRAVQHFRRLEAKRTWLTENEILDPTRLSVFLDQVGLRHGHYKPHIAPARHALAYTVAELYDGGYLSPDALRWLSKVLIHHDPAFIRWRPHRRPQCVGHIGGIPDEDYSYIRLPDDWVEKAEDSHSLLRPRTSEGWIVVGEWTRLKRLQEKWPEEERIATIRAVREDELWDGLDVERGHPPFARFLSAQVSDYLSLHAPEDHLVIACDGRYFETPGADWLAFNPAVGHALGWQPIPGGWFRWADQRGALVVESVWWSDGPLHQSNEHLHVEVGSGWLVLMTESGFTEVLKWARHLSRGGVVRRSLGWHGDAGQRHAIGVLAL
ncbi:MAG: ATP-binding protein [Chloroflexota bacterium]|nr:ATP-binding protein [Chloroflexota bacterium]